MIQFAELLAVKLAAVPLVAVVQFTASYLAPASARLRQRLRGSPAVGGFAAGALCAAALADLMPACGADFGGLVGLRDFPASGCLLVCGFLAALTADQLGLCPAPGSEGETQPQPPPRERDGTELERRPIVGQQRSRSQVELEAAAAKSALDGSQGGGGGGRYGTNGGGAAASDLLEDVQLDQSTESLLVTTLSGVSSSSSSSDNEIDDDLLDRPEASTGIGNTADEIRRRQRRRSVFVVAALCCCLSAHAAVAGWRLGAGWAATPGQLVGVLALRLLLHDAVLALSAGLQFGAEFFRDDDDEWRPSRALLPGCCLAVSLAWPIGAVVGVGATAASSAAAAASATVASSGWIVAVRGALLSVSAGVFVFALFLRILPRLLSELGGSPPGDSAVRARVRMLGFLAGCCALVLGSFAAAVVEIPDGSV